MTRRCRTGRWYECRCRRMDQSEIQQDARVQPTAVHSSADGIESAPAIIGRVAGGRRRVLCVPEVRGARAGARVSCEYCRCWAKRPVGLRLWPFRVVWAYSRSTRSLSCAQHLAQNSRGFVSLQYGLMSGGGFILSPVPRCGLPSDVPLVRVDVVEQVAQLGAPARVAVRRCWCC